MQLIAPFILSVAWITGCHHLPVRGEHTLREQLARVSGEDLFRLAVSHAASGDLLRAEQYFIAAGQRGHDGREVAYWLIRVCVAAGRYRSALRHATEYLRRHPSDWPVRLVAASIYEALGEVSRAEAELERIVSREPHEPLPRYRLAMLYRESEVGRDEARRQLEAYLVLAPSGAHATEARLVLSETRASGSGPVLVPYSAPESTKGPTEP